MFTITMIFFPGNYIIQAAKQISLAQQCEANGNYPMAFTYFKSGIGTLISGVQGTLLPVHFSQTMA